MPGQRKTSHARFPLLLLAILLVICSVSLIAPPAGYTSWILEVGPGLIGVAILIAVYPRFPLSHWVYSGVFLHTLILIYGGVYTYADTPLGNWAMEVFELSRNHYDRIGHLALGAFPAFTIREILLRKTPLERDGWLYFLVVAVVLAIGAFWELLEWWTTLLVAADVGDAFLGSQGDPWDAQWDMALALLAALLVLPLFAGMHDTSMSKVPVGKRVP